MWLVRCLGMYEAEPGGRRDHSLDPVPGRRWGKLLPWVLQMKQARNRIAQIRDQNVRGEFKSHFIVDHGSTTPLLGEVNGAQGRLPMATPVVKVPNISSLFTALGVSQHQNLTDSIWLQLAPAGGCSSKRHFPEESHKWSD